MMGFADFLGATRILVLSLAAWAAAAAMVSSPLSASGPQGARALLVLPGEWHGDEIAVESGMEVLGLFRAPDGSALLAPATLRVEPVRDGVVDDEGETTGRSVSAIGPGEVLAFMAGLDLGYGAVAEASSDRRAMALDGPLELPLGDLLWTLGIECAGGEDRWLTDCDIVLTGPDEARQTLVRYSTGEGVDSLFYAGDKTPTLLWAGDLDRDGRLDLLFDVSDHYNVSETTLFLSSGAAEGELVRPFATFRSTGC